MGPARRGGQRRRPGVAAVPRRRPGRDGAAVILTGAEIAAQRAAGRLTLEPFCARQVNPNSYNYRLGPALRTHASAVIDALGEHPVEQATIGEDGVVLAPGRGFLGPTVEWIGRGHFLPSLTGPAPPPPPRVA